jgi:Mn-dependent DtxR family transcriptional regulator
MTANEIVTTVMTATKTTQMQLAKAMGYATQSAISSKLKATKLDSTAFVKMLEAMGYTVFVVSSDGKSRYKVGDNDTDMPNITVLSAEDEKVLHDVHKVAEKLNVSPSNVLRTIVQASEQPAPEPKATQNQKHSARIHLAD